VREGRKRTPMPISDIEMKSIGNSPVVTYFLSEEELNKYRALPKQPDRKTEEKDMSVGFVPKQEEFLREIASGKSISKLEREWKMNPGSLHYWVGKWNLKGIKPDKAKQLLDEKQIDGNAPRGLTAFNESRKGQVLREKEQPGAESASDEVLKTKLVEANAEIERLRDELAKAIGNANRNSDVAQQSQLELVKARDEHRIKIERLQEELASQRSRIANYESELALWPNYDNQKQLRITELEQIVSELEFERDALLQTIEKAVDSVGPKKDHDSVNHPAHYTAGKVECIDAIEAATTGLSGGQAYNTGAAIKYLWRWSRKNGKEDLKKARWHIDWLIGEVAGK
jgi:hypothetical protein